MDRRSFLSTTLAFGGVSLLGAAGLRAETVLRPSALPGDIWRWSAAETRSAVIAGHVSAREVAEAHFARLAAVNPGVNAVVDQAQETALDSARLADEMLARGLEPGALFAIPTTIKDNTDLKGHRTVNGLASASADPAAEDSPVVRNLRAEGAIILGKTNTPCLASRWETDNTVYGRTLNPWAPGRTPGGSSGGAGAALATGIGALAHGNDIGGSIRYPAFCCGVVGLRPSMGRTPMFNPTAGGDRSFCNQMFNVEGMLARTIGDLWLSLPVISEGDARDPAWNGLPFGFRKDAPQKIGLILDAPGLAVSGPVRQALLDTATALQSAGFIVEEVTPPPIEETVALWARMVFTELRSAWEGFSSIADAGARQANQFFLDITPAISVEDYVAGTAAVMAMRRRWAAFMADYPILIGPNSGELAFKAGFDTVSADETRHQIAAQALMVTVNLLGLPAVAVPTGTVPAGDAPAGLPVGVQVIGRRFADEEALTVAEVIQTALPRQLITDPFAL